MAILVEDLFGSAFKPEVKTSGRKLFASEKVQISSGSESSIHAYARVAPPAQIKFFAPDLTNPRFTVECSCPLGKKSRLCKHIWATLLAVAEKVPDFLEGKTEMDFLSSGTEAAPPVTNNATNESVAPAKSTYQETAKQRASDYRKEQYQKGKAKAKAGKRESSKLAPAQATYPAEVETALHYFKDNGFPILEGSPKEILAEAKRKLSRIFHPDKGGSHQESVELNQHCEVLSEFFKHG